MHLASSAAPTSQVDHQPTTRITIPQQFNSISINLILLNTTRHQRVADATAILSVWINRSNSFHHLVASSRVSAVLYHTIFNIITDAVVVKLRHVFCNEHSVNKEAEHTLEVARYGLK